MGVGSGAEAEEEQEGEGFEEADHLVVINRWSVSWMQTIKRVLPPSAIVQMWFIGKFSNEFQMTGANTMNKNMTLTKYVLRSWNFFRCNANINVSIGKVVNPPTMIIAATSVATCVLNPNPPPVDEMNEM
ncbi:hypothetical protein ACJ5NV_01795 [Loktanella agnita]|uniref:hypothetical protein n=1 Tax=Loktanella agnita TaxID=287097 RepID=UPI003985792D